MAESVVFCRQCNLVRNSCAHTNRLALRSVPACSSCYLLLVLMSICATVESLSPGQSLYPGCVASHKKGHRTTPRRHTHTHTHTRTHAHTHARTHTHTHTQNLCRDCVAFHKKSNRTKDHVLVLIESRSLQAYSSNVIVCVCVCVCVCACACVRVYVCIHNPAATNRAMFS